jgi:hypothetical protein
VVQEFTQTLPLWRLPRRKSWKFRSGKRVFFLVIAAASTGLIFAMPKIASGKHQIAQGNPSNGGAAGFQAGAPVSELVRDDRVKAALEWLAKNTSWIT